MTTQPGVKTRALIDWLARRGHSLPTVPFFVDQTIGGVVATGSHGSSIRFGSVSNLVKYVMKAVGFLFAYRTSSRSQFDHHVPRNIHRALKIVAADGSVRTITEHDGDIWQAASLSVGFLGVIVELTLKVVPDTIVKRELDFIDDEQFLVDLKIAEKDATHFEAVTYW